MPRVAYFPDSFHEVNGVAHTSRHFEAYARRRGLPFLCVRAGIEATGSATGPRVEPEDPNLRQLELERGFLSFALDKDLRYDPAFLRHLPRIAKKLRAFAPDLIHITGPSELGMIGALLAHHFDIPLVASWHTNVHEYLARRSHVVLSVLPPAQRRRGAAIIERATLAAAARFYALARLLFAPNPELCRLLEQATHRPCALMPRGVDAQLFSPAHRTRRPDDGRLVLGYVGRLSVEKNIHLLARIQAHLIAQGVTGARFLIVGQGVEEAWLREHLPRAEFPGVLRGAALAEAYANMDCFVFPSHTDTFGNVVLEALASGVPAIVTPDGGPAHLVEEGITGHIVEDAGFADAIARLLRDSAKDQARLAGMRRAARIRALSASWDAVFDGVYREYARLLDAGRSPAAITEATASVPE
jgi:glycosyltransferase involved in cell wall biosynthesis